MFGENTAKLYKNCKQICSEKYVYSKIQQTPRKTWATEFLQNCGYKPGTLQKINYTAKTFLESFRGYTEHMFFKASLMGCF